MSTEEPVRSLTDRAFTATPDADPVLALRANSRWDGFKVTLGWEDSA